MAQAKLPIKTKLAALTMLISGIIFFSYYGIRFFWLILPNYRGPFQPKFLYIIKFSSSLFLIPFSFFLFKKRKWVPKFSIILLFLFIFLTLSNLFMAWIEDERVMGSSFGHYSLLLAFVYGVILILLLLDRKNYLELFKN